ncbi:MAG: hypothetical protein HVN35_06645 [Methanobacteriaceae archaeon]|nr:hypothetical protein [Methanobacteriaceae archaeon]
MIRCNHCNTENEENTTHCKNCGKMILPEKNNKGNKKIALIAIGILIFLGLIGTILISTTSSEVSEFDQSLIKAVKNGEPSETIIGQIKEHSEANRQGSKKNYDNIVSKNQLDNDSTFLNDVKINYDKELEYIQKIEDLQIRFAKREINEETFIRELKELYGQQPELDY